MHTPASPHKAVAARRAVTERASAERRIDTAQIVRACRLLEFTRSAAHPYNWTLGFVDASGAPIAGSVAPQIELQVDGDRYGIVNLPRTNADFLRIRHSERSVTYASYLEREAFFTRLHAFRGDLGEVLSLCLMWKKQPVHQLITRLLGGNRAQLERLWKTLTSDDITTARMRDQLRSREPGARA